MASKKETATDNAVEQKLKNLYQLQTKLSEIDKIKTLRGELPLEVQDLEDEIEGLTHRLHKYEEEIERLKADIEKKHTDIDEAQAMMNRYQQQLDDVRNNREYDNLTKEIEFQGLEIELLKKKIGEAERLINAKTNDLERGRAFKRIRKSARNGLGIVYVQRDACGGCFNKIPPQRQLDIRMRKKVIVCEYCGRIMIDPELAGVKIEKPVEEKPKRRTTRRKKTEEED